MKKETEGRKEGRKEGEGRRVREVREAGIKRNAKEGTRYEENEENEEEEEEEEETEAEEEEEILKQRQEKKEVREMGCGRLLRARGKKHNRERMNKRVDE